MSAMLVVVAGGVLSGCTERPLEDRNAAAVALGPNLAAPRGVLTPLPPGDQYYPFDATPASPLPFSEVGWDVQLYSRDQSTWYTPEPTSAHHAMDCSGYPGVHDVSTYQDIVFRCRNHIMTSIRASGYGAAILTPDRMLDMSAGDGYVRYDISSMKTSDRDWVNVWISPYDAQLSIPATPFAPGLNGTPRDGIYIQQSNNGNYCPHFVKDFVVTDLACEDWRPLSDFIPPSAVTRNTVEIKLSRTHVTVSMPNNGIVFADVDLPSPLPFAQGVVQFGHYSYNPTKCEWDCANQPPKTPNTWHWDEVHIAPSVPFTIIRGNQRFVDGTGGTVVFAAPAPKNANLRFFAAGRAPELSFDNGKTWGNPVEQVASINKDPERQYWTPVPEGTTSVSFRPGQPITWWSDNAWMARDFSIWSQGGGTVTPPPTPSVPVAQVAVSLNSPSLSVGQTTSATATTYDASNNVLVGRSIAWSTGDPSVAVVSPSGVVSAVGVGSTQITATSEGQSGSATVTITAPVVPPVAPVASLSVSLGATSLYPGQFTTASAVTRDAQGNVLTGRTVTWVSSNSSVATIDPSGAVMANAAGTVTFTGTSEGVSASVSLTVKAPAPVAVNNVVMILGSTTIRVGKTTQATVWVRDAANTVLTGRVVTFSSSNTKVATVSSTGLVTGRAAGRSYITATSEGKKATVLLTVWKS